MMNNDNVLSLCWNNHRSTFSHVMSNLRDKERYSDVTLACEGKFYAVHKLILSVCSDYFDSIFEKTPCKHPVIVLRDVVPEDLEALLAYMYEGIASVPQADLSRLIKTAEFLKVKGLTVPDDPLVATDNQRPPNVTLSTSEPMVNNIDVKVENMDNISDSPPSKKRRREMGNGNDTEEAATPIQANLVSETTVEHKPVIFDPRRNHVELQGSHVAVSNEGVSQSGIYVVDSLKDVKIENESVKANTTEAATATLVSAYMVSDASGNHTLMQSHPEQAHVVTHRFEPALTAPAHSQPLAEAVAEALAGPSGMQTWLGTTELGPTSFTAVEAYSTETGEAHHGQGPTIQLVSTEAANTVTVTTASSETSVPVPIATPTITQVNGPKASSGRTDGNHSLKCHYCNRSTFRQSSDLKRHIRIHTGEKPYECSFCPYKASRKDLLQAHCFKMHNTH